MTMLTMCRYWLARSFQGREAAAHVVGQAEHERHQPPQESRDGPCGEQDDEGLQRGAGDELETAVGAHQPDEADREDVEHRQHVPQLGEAAPQQAGRAVAEDRLGEAGAVLQHEDDRGAARG